MRTKYQTLKWVIAFILGGIVIIALALWGIMYALTDWR